MRILQANPGRPIDLLVAGASGRVVAASAVIGVPGHVEIWEMMIGEVRHRPLVSAREARSLAMTPDGRYLFVAEPTRVVLFDLESTDPSFLHPGPASIGTYPHFSLSADGNHLAVTCELHRLTLFTVGMLPTIESPWPIFEVSSIRETNPTIWLKSPAINSDGTRVAVVRSGNLLGGEDIEIHNTEVEIPVLIPSNARNPVAQLAFAADGSTLLVRKPQPHVLVYNAETGEVVGRLDHPGQSRVTGMAVRPDDGLIATCHQDGTVLLWHPHGYQPVCVLDWKLGKLVSVAFSPDGNIGAAGTEDGQIVVWDVDV